MASKFCVMLPIFIVVTFASLGTTSSFDLGNFTVNIPSNVTNFILYITHNDQPHNILFSLQQYYSYNSTASFAKHHEDNQALQSIPFLQIAQTSYMNKSPIIDGSYELDFNENTQYSFISTNITVNSNNITLNKDDTCLTINGKLTWIEHDTNKIESAPYNFDICLVTTPDRPYMDWDSNYNYYNINSQGQVLSNASLNLSITVDKQDVDYNRILFRYDINDNLMCKNGNNCSIKQAFFGFGEQYSFFNFRGKLIPIVTSEQGIGRGDEPLTTILNENGNYAGGDWHTSYGSKGLYMTNTNHSFIVYNYDLMFFDIGNENDTIIKIELFANATTDSLNGRLIFGQTPIDLIQEITLVTGRMKPLPKWVTQGGILGIEGGSEMVLNKAIDLVVNYNTSLIGVWIQDWVGLDKNPLSKRLYWNWELNTDQYPDWQNMSDILMNKYNIQILTYINPYFEDLSMTNASGFKHNYFKEGVDNFYFILNSTSQPYLINSGSILFGTLDVTNPQAVEWMTNIIQQNMINQTNISGFMADFGEYFPYDAIYHDMSHTYTASTMHNWYPQLWSQIVTNAISTYNNNYNYNYNNKDSQEEYQALSNRLEIVPFHRSSSLMSAKNTISFWYGDQLVSWDSRDGIGSLLYAMFSTSICGMSMIHSDIGGYTMVSNKIFPVLRHFEALNYMRSGQLLLRWIELNAFSDMMFRSHVGNAPNESVQIWSNNKTKEHFSKFSKIFAKLSDYKMKLMNDSYLYGTPIVRHMYYNYFNDSIIGKNIAKIKLYDTDGSNINGNDDNYINNWLNDTEYVTIMEQFMLGDCMLVAPVVHENITSRQVYLPNGVWISYWNQSLKIDNRMQGIDGQFYHFDAPIGKPPVFVCSLWQHEFGN